MHITTVHTLTFTMKTTGNEQHSAAVALVNMSASSFAVKAEVRAMPLPEGDDSVNRHSQVLVHSDDYDRCETYWVEAQRALSFIGVEAVSP